MTTRRSLGGGRVLGNGKSLAPSAPKPQIRGPALLSPSASSVSLSSTTSGTAVTESEDLISRVAIDGHGSAQAAPAATSRMVCPICSEEMMTLLQLNRHIDDNHANLEEIEQDEAKTWFKQQMVKAKKFQPLQLLNQKLRGLDVFESNNDVSVGPSVAAPTTSRVQSPARVPLHQQQQQQQPPPPAIETRPDPEDLITRTHWQRPGGGDVCSDPLCGKRLGAVAGQINCRHCGKLFCDEHTMYQMKLSKSAKHEPARGLWYRVCETCYKSREGYNDHTGATRNHLEHFKSTRRKAVDKQNLEMSRLETRLTRLTRLLADPPPPDPNQSTGTLLWSSLSGAKPHLRNLEQSIVPWQDDNIVVECPFCHQPFSTYGFRRHHCRTCGRVVCADPTTGCSSEVGLDVVSQVTGQKVAVDIRLCKECNRTIFSKADLAREATIVTPDLRAFQNLVQFEHGIRLLLPKFQRLLLNLQDPEKPPSPTQLAEASRVRKRLTDAFTQYEFAARRIRDLPTQSPTQQRLQKAVHFQATNFLHIHMLPLRSLPKILKHAPISETSSVNGRLQPNALASIKFNGVSNGPNHRPGSSRASSTSSAAITALESEERALREQMIVLEEQKFMVTEMMTSAQKRRKFDEAAALSGNIDDLSREIDQLQSQLSQMDFEGAYAAADGIIK